MPSPRNKILEATPAILTEPEQWEEWLGEGAWPEVAHLQGPLPDDALHVVARDVRKDEVAASQRSLPPDLI
jgi:putative SOS response-associated peptidase YedK